MGCHQFSLFGFQKGISGSAYLNGVSTANEDNCFRRRLLNRTAGSLIAFSPGIGSGDGQGTGQQIMGHFCDPDGARLRRFQTQKRRVPELPRTPAVQIQFLLKEPSV